VRRGFEQPIDKERRRKSKQIVVREVDLVIFAFSPTSPRTSPLDPSRQLVIVLNVIRLNHDPALHWLSRDVEFLNMLLHQRIVVVVVAVGTTSDDERVLPHADEHVAEG